MNDFLSITRSEVEALLMQKAKAKVMIVAKP